MRLEFSWSRNSVFGPSYTVSHMPPARIWPGSLPRSNTYEVAPITGSQRTSQKNGPGRRVGFGGRGVSAPRFASSPRPCIHSATWTESLHGLSLKTTPVAFTRNVIEEEPEGTG